MHRLFAATWICLLYVCPCQRCTCQGDGATAVSYPPPPPPKSSFAESDGGPCAFEPGTVLCELPDCNGGVPLCLTTWECSEFTTCLGEPPQPGADAAQTPHVSHGLDAAGAGEAAGDADSASSDTDREDAKPDAEAEADDGPDADGGAEADDGGDADAGADADADVAAGHPSDGGATEGGGLG